MELKREHFGHTPGGEQVDLFTLTNSRGLRVKVMNLGCTIVSMSMPDRRGRPGEITLGYDSLQEYLAGRAYFGALCGRVANRIAGGRFSLEGRSYALACNEKGRHHLHGGTVGFDRRLWRAEEEQMPGEAALVFGYVSPDGEEGYPGELRVTARISLGEDNALSFAYRAETSRPTPVNLTNHSYWNLAGAGSGDVLGHILRLDCPGYLPVDRELIPSGEIAKVAGTPMDFRQEKRIGHDFAATSGGYDHCFVLAAGGDKPVFAARLYEEHSGRGFEVDTTKPAIQLYTGNFLDNIRGAGGRVFARHGAVCLETEFFPDAPNHPDFPSAVLRPGEVYAHTTVLRFFWD
jgi:aldose 1-epimerase